MQQDMHHDYGTLSEALEHLRQEGYTRDFNLREEVIECSSTKDKFQPAEFTIVKALRFEGYTNPDDNSVLYAIEAADGSKGTLVDAYGVYAQAVTPEMAKKLQVNYKQDKME